MLCKNFMQKLAKFYAKILENVKKNNGIHATFLRSLNLDNSLLKTKIKKKSFQFHILRGTSFLFQNSVVFIKKQHELSFFSPL